MRQSALYDEDILLWSEQQADVVRRLGRSQRDLPNDFDVENVAEEIESVGRSELASVESQLQNILIHLIKLGAEPDAAPAAHWRAEILGFHGEMMRRYAPSMRQRIDIQKLWRLARRITAETGAEMNLGVADRCPILLDDVLADDVDVVALVAKAVPSRLDGLT